MKLTIYSQLAVALFAALYKCAAADDLAVLVGYHVVHSYPGLTPPASAQPHTAG
jgi:hypothetical protein